MLGRYRVSVRCNLCGEHQDIAMDLSREGVKAVTLLGQILSEESDWDKSILVCGSLGVGAIESSDTHTSFSDLTSTIREGCR